MNLIPLSAVHYLVHPTLWIVIAVVIALVDAAAPVHADLCVAHLVMLPVIWRLVHRRYVPLLTSVLMLAAILPGLVDLFGPVLLGEQNWGESAKLSVLTVFPTRVLTLLALMTAWLFHANLQRSRRRRLALRRELQQRVRQRTSQLQKVNFALRTEIARREETQHLLNRSETNFNALANRMQLQVLRKDHAGIITYANETFCKHLGLDQAAVVGSTDEDLYPSAIAQIYRADDQRIMRTGQTVDHVEQHPTSDGQQGYVQVFKAPEYDQSGVCAGVQVVFWDVTQKHCGEISLRNSEARKRALFESAGDAVLLVDENQRIVEANPSATVLFSRPVTEIVNRTLSEIASPCMVPAQSQQSSQLTTEREASSDGRLRWDSLPRIERCELTIVRGDESTFASEVSIHPIPIGNAEGTAIILRDVTLRHQAFEALRNAKAAAEAASRSKSEFMAGVSHELRTPLGGIIGLSELLSEIPLSARGRQYVEMIRKNACLLSDFIEDILDFAAIEAGRVQIDLAPMELHRVVGDAFKTLAARAVGKPIHMIFSVDPATPTEVIGDAKRLRQIIVNLVGNAIKFTPNGEVEVRLSVQATAETNFRDAKAGPNTRTVILDVKDTGVGIPLDKQQRVFDAFERGEASTTRRFGGTGLGLSISDGLIQRLGGKIELESQVDVGSRFRCLLPLNVLKMAPSPKQVMLPDDALVSLQNGTVRAAMVEILQGFGVNPLRRLPMRHPTSRRPLVWLIDGSTPFLDQLELERRAQDKVIWLTRLGELLPTHAHASDPIIVEPVLPSDLLAALAGDEVFNSSAADATKVDCVEIRESKTRLLVVDDSEVNRVMLSDQLKAAGYAVDVACDGKEAIDRVSQREFACILMDLQMPDMDGTDATRAIRELYQTRQAAMPPVIALTAHVTEQHRQQCFDAGMDGFLTKPVDRKTLLQMIVEQVGATTTSEPVVATRPSNDDNMEPWQSKLREIAGNDHESICSVCEAFVEEVPVLVHRLQNAVAANDLASAARAAHTLKSCIKHVADEDDVNVFGQLESLAMRGLNVPTSDVKQASEIAFRWTKLVRGFLDALRSTS